MPGQRGPVGADGGNCSYSTWDVSFRTVINYFPKCFIALLQLIRWKQIFPAVCVEAEPRESPKFQSTKRILRATKATANTNTDPVKIMILLMTEVLSELWRAVRLQGSKIASYDFYSDAFQ